MTSAGQAAVERGYITGAQLQEALAIQDRVQQAGLSESLEEILLKKGWLTPEQMTELYAFVGGGVPQAFPGYEIVEKSTTGPVFKARRLADQQPVTIRTLTPVFSSQDGATDRFMREAQLLRTIHHDNVAAVLEGGCHNGLYFLVTESFEGTTLDQILKRGRLPWKDALRIMRQAASGLQNAAAQGVVHKDVRPATIVIGTDGIVKLAELGVARFTDAGERNPLYLSPEQAEGRSDVDHRSDMYSLGLTLLAVLTGKPPFMDEIPLKARERRITEDVPLETLARFEVPDGLRALLRKMCARSRVDRYETWDELLRDLTSVEQGRALEIRESASPIDPTAGAVGRLALEEGLISKEQLAAAVRIQEDLSRKDSRRLLANILVEQGFIRGADLKKLNSLQSFHERHASDRQLGELLVRDGIASAVAVKEAIRKQKEQFLREGSAPALDLILYAAGAITEEQRRAALRLARGMNSGSSDALIGLKECPTCSETIPAESTRCPRCQGTPIESQPQPAAFPCPSCASPRTDSSKRCRNCGIVFSTGRHEMTRRLISCPRCATIAADYETHCASCGASLGGWRLNRLLENSKRLWQSLSWIFPFGLIVMALWIFNPFNVRDYAMVALGSDEGKARTAAVQFLDACTHNDAPGARQVVSNPPKGLSAKEEVGYYAQHLGALPEGSYMLSRYEIEKITSAGESVTVYVKLVFLNESNANQVFTIGGSLYMHRINGEWRVRF